MSGPAPRYPWSVLAAVGAGAATVAAAPGVPLWAPGALAAAVLARGVFDARGPGRGLDRVGPAAWALGPAAALAYVAWTAPSGAPLVGALLAVGCAAGAVALLAPPRRAPGLAALEVAGALVLGATLYAPILRVTLGALAFVALLVAAAVELAARDGTTPAAAGDPNVRRVRAKGDPGRASRAATAAGVALLGFPLGFLLFAVLPAAPGRSTTTGADGAAPASSGGFAAPVREGDGSGEADGALSGLRTGRRSPYLADLRANPRVMLRVRVGEGERGPAPLWLRGDTYDAFDGKAWLRTPSADATAATTPDPDGWVALGPEPDPQRVVRLRCTEVGGAPPGSLPLLPEAWRVRWLAGPTPATLRRRAEGGLLASAARAPGTVWEEESIPGGADPLSLRGARSDPRRAPLPTYGRLPPESDALAALAARVTRGATDAAERAARIEAWMRGADFSYRLAGLAMDPSRPVADFLLRTREGHCWCFASGMALLLRAQGHATRLAVGYRGGDWLDVLREWSFRGTHAHAWCEVWFEGHGWVAFDPTPAAQETHTSAEGAAEEDSLLGRLLRLDPEDRRRLADAGRGLLGALGGALAAWWPLPAGLLLLVAGARWIGRRRRAIRDLAGGAAPSTPYGRALATLASRGLPRRRSETPAEFERRAAARAPEVGPPLAELTSLHVAQRYGGIVPPPSALEAAARRVIDAAP